MSRKCWPVLKRALTSDSDIRAEIRKIINLRDEYGDKPIDDAIQLNQPPDVVHALLDLGSDVGKANVRVTYITNLNVFTCYLDLSLIHI